METLKKTRQVNIPVDPNGNVLLVVPFADGMQVARFQVSSCILCTISPVFRAMLDVNSRFKEGKELAERAGNSVVPVEIKLEDDDPNALGVILWAAHFKTDKVPRNLTFQQLQMIAIAIDKYDCKQAVELWLEFWMPEWRTVKDKMSEKEWPQWLFISYVFGEKSIFKEITKKLILESELSPMGLKPLIVPGKSNWHSGVPEHILEKIHQIRSEKINACLTIAYSYLHSYELFDGKRCRLASASEDEKRTCDTILYGFIVREYKRIGLWPIVVHSSYTASILGLQDLLSKISITHFMSTPGCCMYTCGYSPCSSCLNTKSSTKRKHDQTCNFTSKLRSEVAAIISSFSGLDYDDVFPGKSNKGCSQTGSATWDFI